MSKLTRNQIIAILVFGAVLLGGALVILSNRPTTDNEVVTTTEQVDATAVAQTVPTDEPESTPAPTPIRETRSDDADGDGVPNDGTDQCPDVFGEAAFNGCPNPDSDGDGIDDSKEPAECVGAPDLGFGIGGNGCPNPDPNTVNDDDGDGFVNANDACPTRGNEGFGVDGTGCPLPDPNTVNDDDGDGFVNANDACPTQGDAGFGVDNTGCPNPPPQQPQNQNNQGWDKSSVLVTGECANGIPTFYVTNTGEAGEGDMDAPTSWRLTNVDTGAVIASGSIQVAGGQTQTLQFPEFAGLRVRLNVDQRPGHPGFSEPNAVVENCGVVPTEEPTVEVVPTDEPPPVVPTDEPTPDVTPTDEPTPDVTPVVTPPIVPSSGDFSSSIVCNHNNGTVTFTVTNNGSAMPQGVSYPVTYSTTGRNSASNVSAGNVQRLGAGASQSFTVRSQSGNTITFTVGELGLSQTVECWDKSSVSVSGACVNNIPTFTVNNTGTEGMTAPTTWRVTDVNSGQIILTGTIQLGGSASQILTFPQFSGMTIRLNVDQRPGHPGSSQPNAVVNSSCGVPVTPEVTPTEEITPVVTPTEEPTPDVTPTEEPTPDVTPTPEVTPDDPWDKSSVSVEGECFEGVPTFYVTNTGDAGEGDMDSPTDWRLTNENTGEILASGTIQLAGQETQILQFPEYANLTVRLNVDQRPGHPGFSQPNAVVGECFVPTPEVTPTEEPTPDVTPTEEPTPDVTPTEEPTPDVTPTEEPTPDVTPTPEVTPDDPWDKSSVSVEGECFEGVPTFYVTNTGDAGEGDMDGPTDWRLTNENTGEILESGTIQLAGQETQILQFPEYANLTVRLNVDQRPGHPGFSQPNAVVGECFVPTPEVTPTEEITPVVTPTEEPTPDVTPTEEPTPEVTPTEEPQAPAFTSSLICENNGKAVYTVTLVSGDMGNASYAVTYSVDGATNSAGTLSGLTSGNNTQTFNVRNLSGKIVTFNVEGFPELSATVECWDKSSVSVDGECVNGVIKFFVSNTGTEPMSAPTTWRLENANGQVLTSGTIQLGGSETQTLTFPEFDGQTLRLWVDQRPGHPGFSQPNASVDSCAVPSVYTPSGYCGENGTFGFTITHTGGIGNGVSFTVTDGNTTIDSGTLSHNEAANFNRTYTSTSGTLVFTVTNTDSQVVKVHTQPNCYTAPQITLNGYCEGNGITAFSASVSGSPLGSFSYTIVDQNGSTIASGDLSELFNGVTYTGDYTLLTLSVSGDVDPVSVNPKTVSNCYTAPSYDVDVYCASGGNGIYWVYITDNGFAPLPNTTVEYEVLDADGNPLVSRTAYTSTVYQAFENQRAVTANLYVNGEVVKTDASSECYYPPVYVADGVCDYQAGNGAYRFTASNIGGTPLTTEATFEIVDENGTEVASGNISDLAGLMPIIGTYNSLTMTLFTTEGTIERQADTLSCYQPPVLVASGICADQNGGFSFSVINTGGAVISGVTLPNYSISDVNGTELASGVVSLPFTPVSVTSENPPLTMSFSGGDIAVESAVSPSDCFLPPVFEPNVYCGEENGVFVVSIINKGGAIVSTLPTYEIFIDGVSQGVVEFSTNVDLPMPAGKYGNVSVTVTYGDTTVSADNSTCYKQPEYTPAGYCGSNGQFFFSITQTGGGTPVDGGQPTFEIMGDGFTTVTGNMSELPTMPIVGVYENGLTMTVTTEEGIITVDAPITLDCYEPPVWTPVAVCGDANGLFLFSIQLVSGSPITGEEPTYTIETVGNPVFNESGPISQLPSSITGRYSSVTLTIKTTEGSVSAQAEPLTTCYNPPVYVPSVECTDVNGEFTVNVVNTGGMPVGDGVTILVDFAVINGGGTAADLIENAQLPFTKTYTGPYQYVGVSVSSPDVEPVSANNDTCYNPPVYVPEAVCGEENGTFNFSITNVGGAPIEPELVEFTLWDENFDQILSDSQFPPYSGSISGTYQSVTLMIDRTETSATVENCYNPPQFVAELFCLDATTSTYGGQISNIGGASNDSLSYQVLDAGNNIVAEGTVNALPFTLPTFSSTSTSVTLLVYVGESIVSVADAGDCVIIVTETPTPTPDVTPTPEPTPEFTPEEPVCGETFETPDGQITINLDMCNPDPEIGVPSWSPIQIGGAICPDWLVYHTNMTGDWELFRLGNLPDGLTGPENLSRGIGEDVYDLAPSRSPDGLWIAFASTRDTVPGSRTRNWEIYVAKVTGDDTRRITYNEFAMDLDPVWSPNGLKLAYETTTDNGDWEIRIFDLLTGENTLVTNNPANDINPSWSPDGTKLLIQSDREDGLWQIYEIDLANGNAVTRLSDGTGDDHDPMYSNDGTKIVFRSYRDDPRPENDRSRQSSVYYMNTDGTGVTRVSDLGGNATNHVFSPDDTLIAYQSNIAGGINDIYVYEIATGLTRLLTNNTGDYANIQDTAPTWYCDSTMLVFTSSVDATVDKPNNTNIFMVNALPIDAPPINADEDATRLTDDEEIDRDAQNSPSEENASRYGQVPPKWRP